MREAIKLRPICNEQSHSRWLEWQIFRDWRWYLFLHLNSSEQEEECVVFWFVPQITNCFADEKHTIHRHAGAWCRRLAYQRVTVVLSWASGFTAGQKRWNCDCMWLASFIYPGWPMIDSKPVMKRTDGLVSYNWGTVTRLSKWTSHDRSAIYAQFLD